MGHVEVPATGQLQPAAAQQTKAAPRRSRHQENVPTYLGAEDHTSLFPVAIEARFAQMLTELVLLTAAKDRSFFPERGLQFDVQRRGVFLLFHRLFRVRICRC
jgi:hypothetical protein